MTTQKINSSELKDLSLADLYQKLDATENGLKTEEAVDRSKEFGYNVLSGVKAKCGFKVSLLF